MVTAHPVIYRMTTKFIGKFGEYIALSRLLANEIEAYPAIRSNQVDYDITAITQAGRVVRIEVKSTELHNASTNNSIGALAKTCDFLVVVVANGKEADCYVLPFADAVALRGTSRELGTTQLVDREKRVKPSITVYLERWDRIRDFGASPSHSVAHIEVARA